MVCRFASSIALLLCLLPAACGDDGTSSDDGSAPSTTTGPGGSSTAAAGSGTADTGTTAADGTTAASSTGPGVCELEQPAIVTDIDATLTISDGEFTMQIGDGNYDPIEREGAAELIGAYADLGYHVLYLTARSEEITVDVTEETAREVTERWLDEHGFPTDPERTEVVLAPMFVFGDDAQAYKSEALMERQATGLRFDYAYGNATSDIGAYAAAAIPLDATFIIGEHGGEGGTVAVAGEGWTEHADAHLPTVPAVCE